MREWGWGGPVSKKQGSKGTREVPRSGETFCPFALKSGWYFVDHQRLCLSRRGIPLRRLFLGSTFPTDLVTQILCSSPLLDLSR